MTHFYDKDSRFWVVVVILVLFLIIIVVLMASGRMSSMALIALFATAMYVIPYMFLNEAGRLVYLILFGIFLVFLLSLDYRRWGNWWDGLLILLVVLFTIVGSTIGLILEQRRHGLWPELS